MSVADFQGFLRGLSRIWRPSPDPKRVASMFEQLLAAQREETNLFAENRDRHEFNPPICAAGLHLRSCTHSQRMLIWRPSLHHRASVQQTAAAMLASFLPVFSVLQFVSRSSHESAVDTVLCFFQLWRMNMELSSGFYCEMCVFDIIVLLRRSSLQALPAPSFSSSIQLF